MRRHALIVLLVVVASTIAPTMGTVANAQDIAHVASACSAVADAVVASSPSQQLITVVAPTQHSQRAVVNLYVRRGGCFRLVAGPYSAFVGLNGLSPQHREGDDTTPMGLFGFQSTMYGVLANPGVSFRYHRLVCGDWWDEQSSSPSYNRFVHVPCATTPPFGGGSEALWESVPSYDYFAVIDFNRSPTVPGRGSAIFLHVASGRPTAGCVSIPAVDLLRVLRALRPTQHPLIDITTQSLLPT